MPHIGEKCNPSRNTVEEVARCLGTDRLVVLKNKPHKGKCCKVIGAHYVDRNLVRFKFRVNLGWPLRAGSDGVECKPEEFELVINRLDINDEVIVLPESRDIDSQNKLLTARSLYRK